MRRDWGRPTGGSRSRPPVLDWARWHPVTAGLIALLLLAFLHTFFRLRLVAIQNLAFVPPAAPHFPSTALTWPLASVPDPFSLLFECWWLWIVGGELESRKGSLRVSLLVLAATLVGALGYGAWWLLSRGAFPVPLGGFGVPLGALTVAWCLANPGRVVLFSLLVPVSGRTLLWLSLALLYLSLGLFLGPLAGLFVAAGALVAIPWSRWGERPPSARHRSDRLSLFDRFRLWRARRRMRKVWDADEPSDTVH